LDRAVESACGQLRLSDHSEESTMKSYLTHALRRRRGFLAAALLALAGIALPSLPALAQGWNTEQWVGTWGTAPAGPPLPAATQTFNDQTLRLIVHTSIGGNQLRIRISNELGTTPLRIGSAHIARR
jgi:hypothetical protein